MRRAAWVLACSGNTDCYVSQIAADLGSTVVGIASVTNWRGTLR